MKYMTLTQSVLFRLDEEVNQHLSAGWEIFGNQYYANGQYVQVLVWYDE